jgi:MoxR-like ATPase
MQERAREVFVHHALAEYVVRLVTAPREPQRFSATSPASRPTRR